MEADRGSPVGAASCGAVEAFARSLAIDLAPIRVNTIAPGLIDTPLIDELAGEMKQAIVEREASRLPVKRIGTPEDIADAVLFLMKNGFVTGITLTVDGGRLLILVKGGAMEFSICIDVDAVDRAVEFYGRGLGLTVVENHPYLAHLKLGAQTFWIMKAPAGVQGKISRDYRRHWTPVHLDFAVEDIDEAVRRAVDAGGKLEGEIQRSAKGAFANMVDPSGNGVDLFCPVK